MKLSSNEEQKDKVSENSQHVLGRILRTLKGRIIKHKERIRRRWGAYFYPPRMVLGEEQRNVHQLFRLGIFFLPNELWPIFDRRYKWFDLEKDEPFYHDWAKVLGTGLFWELIWLSLVTFFLVSHETTASAALLGGLLLALPFTGMVVWLMVLILRVKFEKGDRSTAGNWLLEVLFHLAFYSTFYKIYKGSRSIWNWAKQLWRESTI